MIVPPLPPSYEKLGKIMYGSLEKLAEMDARLSSIPDEDDDAVYTEYKGSRGRKCGKCRYHQRK